jgi:PEGA domain-containing protein
MKKLCLLAVMLVVAGLSPVAFAKTHRDTYPVSCDVLWPAVKDVVRNSGKYGIIGIDSTEMSISYNIGGGLGGKRINSVVLNRKGDKECEMQTQTAYSGMIHNDAGDFKDRVEKALKNAPPVAEAAKKEVVQQPKPSAVAQPIQPAIAPDPEHGVLAVNANMEAVQLSIDGKVIGTTPARMQLTPGKHTIRGVLEGYDSWEKEVEVLAESEMNLKIVLKKTGI